MQKANVWTQEALSALCQTGIRRRWMRPASQVSSKESHGMLKGEAIGIKNPGITD